MPGTHLKGGLDTGGDVPADWMPLVLPTTGTGISRGTRMILRQYQIIYNSMNLLVFVSGFPLLIGSVLTVPFPFTALPFVPILARYVSNEHPILILCFI